jgi:hypothetical protein
VGWPTEGLSSLFALWTCLTSLEDLHGLMEPDRSHPDESAPRSQKSDARENTIIRDACPSLFSL